MSKKTVVILGAAQERLNKRQIAKGLHALSDNTARAAIDLLPQSEVLTEHFRQLIAEGEASGDFQEVNFDGLALS